MQIDWILVMVFLSLILWIFWIIHKYFIKNGENYQSELILIVKNQEFNIEAIIRKLLTISGELIIIDNCSQDNTWEIIKRMARKYENLKIYRWEVP